MRVVGIEDKRSKREGKSSRAQELDGKGVKKILKNGPLIESMWETFGPYQSDIIKFILTKFFSFKVCLDQKKI